MTAVTRTAIVTVVLAFALPASAAAAPARRAAQVNGGTRAHAVVPQARVVAPRTVVVRRSFFDPFWGPYYPYWGYSYAYPYPTDYSVSGDLKTKVTPKLTQVYVDGYYAGVAGDFDGALHHLRMSPGGHDVTLQLDGYRTVTEHIYVGRGSTYKLTETMQKLAPGKTASLPARGER